MKKIFVPLFILFTMIGCSKDNQSNQNNGNTCTPLTSVTSSVSATSVEKGKPLSFQATNVSGFTYQWTIPGSNMISTANGNISAADFTNEGWYYLVITNNCSQSRKDSFFVDVTMPQGAAPCSPTNNTITFSANGSNGTFTSIIEGETGANDYRMEASGGGNEFTIRFHPSYRNNNQPEDGIYTTGTFNGSYPSFGTNDFDKVFITNITYFPVQVYYRSIPNQKVYISHVNGKMRATLCSVGYTGTANGTTYTPTVNAMLTEQ